MFEALAINTVLVKNPACSVLNLLSAAGSSLTKSISERRCVLDGIFFIIPVITNAFVSPKIGYVVNYFPNRIDMWKILVSYLFSKNQVHISFHKFLWITLYNIKIKHIPNTRFSRKRSYFYAIFIRAYSNPFFIGRYSAIINNLWKVFF